LTESLYFDRLEKMPRRTRNRVELLPLPKPKPLSLPLPQRQNSGFLETVKEGFGFGIGSSIARSMFDSGSFSASSTASSHPFAPTTTEPKETKEYTQCRKEGGDHESCKQLLE